MPIVIRVTPLCATATYKGGRCGCRRRRLASCDKGGHSGRNAQSQTTYGACGPKVRHHQNHACGTKPEHACQQKLALLSLCHVNTRSPFRSRYWIRTCHDRNQTLWLVHSRLMWLAYPCCHMYSFFFRRTNARSMTPPMRLDTTHNHTVLPVPFASSLSHC